MPVVLTLQALFAMHARFPRACVRRILRLSQIEGRYFAFTMRRMNEAQNAPKSCCTPAAGHAPSTKSSDAAGAANATETSLLSQCVPGDLNAIPRISQGSTDGMIRCDGGPFIMGTDIDEGFPADGEGPAREVTLRPFWMDQTTVTNRQFADFIKATGYVTEAEEFGWSFVFHNQLVGKLRANASDSVQQTQWWLKVDGAYWAKPEGPGSKLGKRMQHPVVHVSWRDAMAYATWAGKRLPTEAEFEYACRGGHNGRMFPWGNELEEGGQHHCNVFQGTFPQRDTAADGFAGPCPVTAFPPNDYGFYGLIGNVWEWCLDWWTTDPAYRVPCADPFGPPSCSAKGSQEKVIKGGSFLCHDSYCNRYRNAARTKNEPNSSTVNMGFRCVRDIDA